MAINYFLCLQCTNKLLHSEKCSHLQPLTNAPQKIITKTIWVLSFVSLFTDVASEMLYPVMPLFLKHIGYTAIFIGILEGVAEAVAGLSKSYFGKRSDISGKRLPFVQLGYFFSAVSKPMLAIFIYPWWIFLSRTIDRLGKGIRTGARDAMLSDESRPETKGRVFGFHRSMDSMGAVIGPAIALVYLYFYPNNYKTLFLNCFFTGHACSYFNLDNKREKENRGCNQQRKTNNDQRFRLCSLLEKQPGAIQKISDRLIAICFIQQLRCFSFIKNERKRF